MEISISLLSILIMTLSLISVPSEDIIGEELIVMSLMLRFIQEEKKENLVLEIMIAMLFMARMKKESV